jgi:hypothetical protein
VGDVSLCTIDSSRAGYPHAIVKPIHSSRASYEGLLSNPWTKALKLMMSSLFPYGAKLPPYSPIVIGFRVKQQITTNLTSLYMSIIEVLGTSELLD